MNSPDEDLSEAMPQGRYYEVPAMNVQHFIGRLQLLARMESTLAIGDDGNDRTKVLVLRGMGGL